MVQPEDREDRDRIELPGLPSSLVGVQGQVQSRITETSRILEELSRQRGSLLDTGPTVAGAPERPEVDRRAGIAERFSAFQTSRAIGAVSPLTSALYASLPRDLLEIQATGQAVDDISTQIIDLETQIYWDVYLSGVMNSLPTTVRAFPELTADEFIEQTRPGETTPDNIRQTISFVINEIRDDVDRQQEIAAEQIARAQDPRGLLSDLYNIDPESLSANELIDSIVRAGQFQRDPEVSPVEFRDYLLELGFPREHADAQVIDLQAQAQRFAETLRQWTAQHNLLLDDGRKIESGEIISAWKKAQWSRAASQPALALLRPIEWWVNKISKPFAATAVLAGNSNLTEQLLGDFGPEPIVIGPEGLREAFTGEASGRNLELEIRKAQAEGHGYWKAAQIGFDNWETNWAIKFGLEVVADPITYLGFGLATKITKGIPYIGRGVGAFEAGFITVADAPFRFLKNLWVGDVSGRATGEFGLEMFRQSPRRFQGIAPRTLRLKGDRIAREGVSVLKSSFEQASNGKPIYFATPGEMRQFATQAVETAIQEPQGLDDITRLGKLMIGYKVIGREEAQTLARTLTNVSDDIALNAETGDRTLTAFLEHLNRIVEDVDGIAIGNTKFLKPNEARESILQLYGVTGEVNARAVTRWLAQQRNSARREAIGHFGTQNSVREQIGNFHDGLSASFVRAARSEVQIKRYQQGIVSRLMGDISAVRLPFVQAIDQFVTRPFARAYLVFAYYPVGNILEAAVKTALAGGNPFKLGNPYAANAMRFHRLETAVPLNAALPGDSFNLGLGYIDDAVEGMTLEDLSLRRLPGVQPTEKQGALARVRNFSSSVDPRNIFYQFTAAYNQRQSMRYLGNLFTDAIGYNQGNRLVNAQYASYLGQMFDKFLRKQSPHVWDYSYNYVSQAATRAGIDDLVAKGTLDSEVAESLRETIFRAMLSGEAGLVRNVPEQALLSRVSVGAAEKLLMRYTELPNVMYGMVLRSVQDGRAFTQAGMEATRQELENFAYHFYMSSVDVFREGFEKLSNDLINTPAASPEELLVKINMLESGLTTFDGALGNTTKTTVEYATGITDSVARGNFYDEVYNDSIHPAINDITARTEQIAKAMRRDIDDQLAQATTPEARGQIEGYRTLTDEILKSTDTWRAVGNKDLAIRAEYFNPTGQFYISPGRGRTQGAFWGPFFAKVRGNWNDGHAEIRNQRSRVLDAKAAITGQRPALLPDVSQQEVITTLDLSRLMGVMSPDIDRSIYVTELRALKAKDDFVHEVMDTARLSGQVHGVNPRALGWTNERVGGLYNKIASKIAPDPDNASVLAPMKLQINSLMSDLRTLGINKGAMVNEEAELAYRSLADSVANQIDKRGLRILGDIAPPVEETVVEPTTRALARIDPVTDTLEEGLSQAAREEYLRESSSQISSLSGKIERVINRRNRNISAVESIADDLDYLSVRLTDNEIIDEEPVVRALSDLRFFTSRYREIQAESPRVSARIPRTEALNQAQIERRLRAVDREIEQTREGSSSRATQLRILRDLQEERLALRTASNDPEVIGEVTRDIPRLRTQTIRNPELEEIYENGIKDTLTNLEESLRIISFIREAPRNYRREVFETIRRIPTREAEEGTVQVYHGTPETDYFRQFEPRVPPDEIGGPLSVPSTYTSRRVGTASLYAPRYGEPFEAGSFRIGNVYDVDLDISQNFRRIDTGPPESVARPWHLAREQREQIQQALDDGIEVIEFTASQEFVILNPDRARIVGVSNPRGYMRMNEVPEETVLPGLEDSVPGRVFEGTGDVPACESCT